MTCLFYWEDKSESLLQLAILGFTYERYRLRPRVTYQDLQEGKKEKRKKKAPSSWPFVVAIFLVVRDLYSAYVFGSLDLQEKVRLE